MSKETSDKDLRQSQEVLPVDTELQSLIEAARQNPVLSKILQMLSDNKNDTVFLNGVVNAVKVELREKECRDERKKREQAKLEARRNFCDSLFTNGLYKKQCYINARGDFPRGTPLQEIRDKQIKQVCSTHPFQLTEEMLKILDDAEAEIKNYFNSLEEILNIEWCQPNQLFLLARPDGKLILMQVFGFIEAGGNCEFELIEIKGLIKFD